LDVNKSNDFYLMNVKRVPIASAACISAFQIEIHG
jgi:hypothetical protein